MAPDDALPGAAPAPAPAPAAAAPGPYRSKTLATWIAVIGGALGLHRFYLRGFGDPWGWLFPLPTLMGFYGIRRVFEFGQDDLLSWVLMPFAGVTVSVAMLTAVIHGLTPDETWRRRHNPGRASIPDSGWGAVLGVILALMVGAGVLMATIAFSAQRFFEYQAM